MLNRLSSAVKPAATPAIAASWVLSSSPYLAATPISEPPNTSCSMGEAMPITPMPALTFMHSTIHTSQNWGILKAFFTCTWRCVIMVLEAWMAGGVQPSGCQPVAGPR